MAKQIRLHVQTQIAGADHVCAADIAFVPHFDRRKTEYWQLAAHGTLNRSACTTCGRTVDADRSFLYADLARGVAILVFPKDYEGDTTLPPDLISADIAHLRSGWIKGLDGFRELLWMHELGIDDVTLREVKRHIVVQNGLDPSTDLCLSTVDDGTASFAADASGSTFGIAVDQVWQVGASITDARGSVATTRERRRRYISRSNSRLDWLDAIDVGDDPALQACKAQLRAMLESDGPAGDIAPLVAPLLQKFPADSAATINLFREASGIALSDVLIKRLHRDASGKDATATMWRAFAELPPALRGCHALSLEEIDVDPARNAVLAAYVPGTNSVDFDRISLSFNVIRRAQFPHALRHEIAHAIHERCPDPINAWLTAEFGWKWFAMPKNWAGDPAALADPIDRWIEELGGWEIAAPQAKSDDDRILHRKMIRFALQPGLPDRGYMMQSHLKGICDQPAWFGDSVARRVHIQTGADWWKNAGQWVELPIGSSQPTRLAMMNYQYSELAVLNISCRDIVKSGDIPERYALMSHREFFAEFYATWHDDNSRLKISHPDFGDFMNSLS